jgi:Kef-type K+ transport system membrane component KefB
LAAVLGLGRWLGPKALRWVQPHVAWPSGYIAVTPLLVLLASSASEALGVLAFLGACLMGAALGEARDKHRDAHDVIGQFVTSFVRRGLTPV